MVNKSNIGELTVEQKDFRVTIKQKEEHVTQVVSAPPVQAVPVQVAAPQPAGVGQPSAPGAEKQKSAETLFSFHIFFGGFLFPRQRLPPGRW